MKNSFHLYKNKQTRTLNMYSRVILLLASKQPISQGCLDLSIFHMKTHRFNERFTIYKYGLNVKKIAYKRSIKN